MDGSNPRCIFLASSIVEFKRERVRLVAFVERLNAALEGERSFEVVTAESFSKAVARTRKQDEYNEVIRNCDYFVLLLGNPPGSYTAEEMQVAARAQAQAPDGRPLICVFTRSAPMGELALEQLVSQGARPEFVHTSCFSTVRELLGKLLFALLDGLPDATPCVRDDGVWVRGHWMLGAS